jgi:hypothetical protein
MRWLGSAPEELSWLEWLPTFNPAPRLALPTPVWHRSNNTLSSFPIDRRKHPGNVLKDAPYSPGIFRSADCQQHLDDPAASVAAECEGSLPYEKQGFGP